MDNNSSFTITFSYNALFRILAVAALVYFLFLVIDVVALVLVAMLLATALEPSVAAMQRWGLPRPLAILSIYVVLLGTVSIILYLMVPPLVTELTLLAESLPEFYEKLTRGFSGFGGLQGQIFNASQQFLQNIGDQLASFTTSIFSTLVAIFGGIIQFVATLVIVFYLAVDKDGLKRFIRSVTPGVYKEHIGDVMTKIQNKLGAWLRGQLILMFIIGALAYVALLIVGVPYALVLALWAGLTEILPYLGPVLGAIPAILIAFTLSPIKGLVVLLLYIAIQQLENHVFVPQVMRRSVGLNPIVSIVVILIGIRLGGVVGGLVSIPVATIIAVIMTEFFDQKIASYKGELLEPKGPIS